MTVISKVCEKPLKWLQFWGNWYNMYYEIDTKGVFLGYFQQKRVE